MLKIITTGRLGKEFYNEINKNKVEFEIKFLDVITDKDIEWADCLAAFSVSDEINISGIYWIYSFSAGVEGFLQRNDISNKTILTRTVGNLGFKMGEFCLCHILNFFQNILTIYENNKLRKWESNYHHSLKDKSLLILGTGEMARGISLILNPIRLKIIGANTTGSTPGQAFDKCVKFNEIKTISNQIYCIINTLPLSQNTMGLLDGHFFNLFQNALFINVGRGKSVVTGDLIKSIDNSSISYAVLDVFDTEPLPKESPLWDNPNIFISPHQSAVTDIEDITNSFCEAYRLIKSNSRNYLFVDFNKGY